MGHPGTLPYANKEAIRSVLRAGAALGSSIPMLSKFDRKNYFYPDLPKGYQISQYDMPLCVGGSLETDGAAIAITRIHLEEDTGKLMHPAGADYSLVDYNRAGVPLMELVTEPVIASAKQARKFCEELQLLFRYLGISEANMEKGEMRCEANVSVTSEDGEWGTKVEVKNLNSFKSVEDAINYEIKRQTGVLNGGGTISQETRGWDKGKKHTFSQRSKEQAFDYRYFPEPDLLPLDFRDKKFIDVEEIQNNLPELPRQKRERFAREFGLPAQDIEVLVFDRDLADYFEDTVSELIEWADELGEKIDEAETKKLVKLAANYLLSDFSGILKEKLLPIKETLITPENFAELVCLVYENKVSSRAAKDILREMFKKGEDPSHILERTGVAQVSDVGEIEVWAQEVIDANEKAAADFKGGNEKTLQFLVGQLMAKSRGKANPKLAADVLKKLLS